MGLSNSPHELYYRGLTAHGVLLAIVLTTFYIVGLSAYLTPRVIGVNIKPRLLSISLIVMVTGTILAAIAILAGWANVLYTFYLPLIAHPLFYLGAVLLSAIPLPFFGILATYIVWIMATTPLVFIVLKNHIPASVLGSNTDVLESRLYFW
ncbi:MAG: cbb3-type cytochrome c oxidase subunit I [Acidilobaceae archaeon]